ncbi:MAG: hypothetical protein A2V90_03270 [Gammaproteobacteria bacterium RBG_16_57_12]|nr:MAG: hypothetical protein A2V90_03270 [Gammaproteobacteria bacterium RBG_16_57_12]
MNYKRGDILVMIMALSLVAALFATLWGDSRRGEEVRILAGDKQLALVSLSGHREIRVDGPLGTSTLEIDNGRIRFADSPCANKVCVHDGWASRGGEVVACLPNRVSVAILGGEYRFDAINF